MEATKSQLCTSLCSLGGQHGSTAGVKLLRRLIKNNNPISASSPPQLEIFMQPNISQRASSSLWSCSLLARGSANISVSSSLTRMVWFFFYWPGWKRRRRRPRRCHQVSLFGRNVARCNYFMNFWEWSSCRSHPLTTVCVHVSVCVLTTPSVPYIQ